MNQKKRLLGIDLCRGIAAYAVILVHSGDETWGVPVDPWADYFRLSFYFAVPFFLITSFYFIACKPNTGFSPNFWKSRLERLVIPYLIWSLIYLVLRLVFFWKANQSERLNQLTQDPLSLVFFGGTSFHLYFLPLLFVGSFLIFFIKYFLNQPFKTKQLIIFSILSIIVYELVIVPGDTIQASTDINPLIRLVLVYAVWVLKCLPYFLTAIILRCIFLIKGDSWLFSRKSSIVLVAIFFITTIMGRLVLPVTLRDLIVAHSLFLFGISVSQYIKGNKQIVANLGLCAFGIYLIHPILMNFAKLFFSLFGVIEQVTISSLLIISVTTFLLSWIVVALMLQHKWSAKYLFGV
ncbi:acyltransferase [Gloeocapsopsis sp. IPPAS B-1203]|uniref:acyltransferase n=1 Tax=Gloeocapsopsis sp. IPPAS B-1203 TaxID=2049454 RepID=UPI0025A27F0B|nr:acyltransferase [Gloeocapsopsis sp. IPPAS B-1203]